MITSNVYKRVFRISYRDECGTCFTVDEGGKQYLVTATHVVEGIKDSDQIQIFCRDEWFSMNCKLVGNAPGGVDITVLALDQRLSPALVLPPTAEGLIWGQEVFFLGFPYNMYANIGEAYPNFPFPFVKRATLSCTMNEPNKHVLFLDGHNNPGFSGGPVVFVPFGENEFRVCGVISSFRYNEEPVYDGDQATDYALRYNTGIIISYEIRHAMDLIRANPIGFKLPQV